MACFIVPMTLAIILSIVRGVAKSFFERLRLGLLTLMLWGGTALLIIEHIWHGEVVPWPPFLTAMSNPSDIPVMIHEMAVNGTAMTAAVVSVWAVITSVSRKYLPTIKANLYRVSRTLSE